MLGRLAEDDMSDALRSSPPIPAKAAVLAGLSESRADPAQRSG
jgi:hypothetical protein